MSMREKKTRKCCREVLLAFAFCVSDFYHHLILFVLFIFIIYFVLAALLHGSTALYLLSERGGGRIYGVIEPYELMPDITDDSAALLSAVGPKTV